MKIDLNCDMGESFGAYTLGMDEAIIASVTSANIACGFHAGDPQVMNRTVRLALDYLLGFGRRAMECSSEEIEAYLIYQIGALQAFCTAHGAHLGHVKPHGALYNLAVGNESLIRSIVRAIAAVDRRLAMVTLAGTNAERTAAIAGEEDIVTLFEAFPDRAYTPEGTLVSRRLPGAVIHNPEEAAERAVRMAIEGEVIAIDGSRVPLTVHTLCVHGDNPNGVALAATLRKRLEEAGVAVRPMAQSLPR
jgi:5-oxoprolinase (ATP-hydrolysing) subunit A